MRPPSPLLLALLLLGACETPAEPASTIEAVVHDADDRRDLYQESDPALAALARDSIVALIPHTRLAWNGSGYDVVGVTDLSERQNLCPDERFADQPTVATCSGTLIDDDLVLTAGHCMVPQGSLGTASCTTTRFVFDFAMADASTIETIALEDVYRCRAVLAHRWDDSVDYAVVQLDRPVTGRSPASVRSAEGALAVGTPLVEIGFPTGMPLKIDAGGRVLDPGPPDLPYFVTDLDAFRGNSGSGVFDADEQLVGIVARTMEADYVYDASARCYRTAWQPSARGSIEATYADLALLDLCETQGYPSSALCGVAPACGDSACTAGETTSCVADCAGPICGDGICLPGDTARSCPYDCGATIDFRGTAGCSVAGRPSLSLLPLLLLLPFVRGRRGRRWVLGACVLLALSPSVADAQPRIHPWGLRFVGTAEVDRDHATLWNPTKAFGTLETTGVGYGLRLGADLGLGRYAGLEATVGGSLLGTFGLATVDLAIAPRFRMLLRTRHDLYLRAPLGGSLAFDPYGDPTSALLAGLGLGYRFQLTRVVDAFVELEVLGRFGRAVEPYFAYLEGYGLHPSSPPHLRTSTLGLRLGIGLGRGYR